MREAAGAVERFLVEHADALLAAEQQRAAPLVREVDDLAARIVAVRQDLAASEARSMRVVHAAHRGRERYLTSPRSDSLVQAAAELLGQGGERVPAYVPPPEPRTREPLVRVDDEALGPTHRERTTRPAEEAVR